MAKKDPDYAVLRPFKPSLNSEAAKWKPVCTAAQADIGSISIHYLATMGEYDVQRLAVWIGGVDNLLEVRRIVNRALALKRKSLDDEARAAMKEE